MKLNVVFIIHTSDYIKIGFSCLECRSEIYRTNGLNKNYIQRFASVILWNELECKTLENLYCVGPGLAIMMPLPRRRSRRRLAAGVGGGRPAELARRWRGWQASILSRALYIHGLGRRWHRRTRRDEGTAANTNS